MIWLIIQVNKNTSCTLQCCDIAANTMAVSYKKCVHLNGRLLVDEALHGIW